MRFTDFEATSAIDFVRLLESMENTVLPLGQGRTTEQCETWSFRNVFATLARNSELSFPIRVEHKDRPDFLVEMREDVLGIEHTSTLPQNYARAIALANYESGPATFCLSKFSYGQKHLSVHELKEILLDGAVSGPGWAGNEPEKEWSCYLLDSIVSKEKSALKEGFQLKEQNWLLIYDNTPLIALDIETGVHLLIEKLNENNVPTSFDQILIETSDKLIQIFRDLTWKSTKLEQFENEI